MFCSYGVVVFIQTYQPNVVTVTQRAPEAQLVPASLLSLWAGKAATVEGFQGCVVGISMFVLAFVCVWVWFFCGFVWVLASWFVSLCGFGWFVFVFKNQG